MAITSTGHALTHCTKANIDILHCRCAKLTVSANCSRIQSPKALHLSGCYPAGCWHMLETTASALLKWIAATGLALFEAK